MRLVAVCFLSALYICIYIRGRPNLFFFFVFGPKNDDFSVFGLLFFGRKSLPYFGFILFFGLIIPENCRKMHRADGQMKFWNLSTSRLQLQVATSLHAAWLTVYQQVTCRMAISRRRLYSADYAASQQGVKSRHFELGPGANRHVRSHCPDNETHSTLANKRCQRAAI